MKLRDEGRNGREQLQESNLARSTFLNEIINATYDSRHDSERERDVKINGLINTATLSLDFYTF